jgi:hypothetical protein
MYYITKEVFHQILGLSQFLPCMLLSNVHTDQQHILESFAVSMDPPPPPRYSLRLPNQQLCVVSHGIISKPVMKVGKLESQAKINLTLRCALHMLTL